MSVPSCEHRSTQLAGGSKPYPGPNNSERREGESPPEVKVSGLLFHRSTPGYRLIQLIKIIITILFKNKI